MHFLKSRRSIELSLSFIVVLIISIVILGFGIKFITDLSSRAIDISQISQDDLDRRMANLLCESSERVCVSAPRKKISPRSYDIVGVKIINILDPSSGFLKVNFEINVLPPAGPPSGLLGYDIKNQPIVKIPGFDGLEVYPSSKSIDMEKYGERNLGFAVQVPANAPPGTYILNFEIRAKGSEYAPLQQVYIEVP
jgi:hypothetical protein